MGTGYDWFDTLAHTLDPRIQGDQLKNRLLLKDGLEKQGLLNYDKEWWHFTLKHEAYPDTYFDFPVNPSSLTDTQ
jgi:D-alanyl-D-alanine dipeptidase